MATRTRKRQRTANQPPRLSGDTSLRTPTPASGGIVIQEPTGGARPTVRVGSNVASSSSRLVVGLQTFFRLRNEPLPMMTNFRSWAQGEGGRVARSLGQGLQLPKDMHFFLSNTDESLATRLQWHTIAVIHFIVFCCTNILIIFLFMFIVIVVTGCLSFSIEESCR